MRLAYRDGPAAGLRQLGIEALRAYLYASPMRRFPLFLLFLAILWTGAWFYLTGVLRHRFEASLAHARALGWVITAGRPARAGFPLEVAIAVPDVTASGGTALPVAGDIHARRVIVAVAVARPEALAIDLPAGLDVRPAHGAPVAVRATTLVGSAPLDGPPSIEFDATGLTVAKAGSAGAVAARARLRLEPRGSDLGFDLDLGDVRLPPGNWPLGPTISSLTAVGLAGGALAVPPANGVRGAAGWLQDWRDHGGKLTLDRLALDWGPLKVDGSGTAALDAALQPDGEAKVTVDGYNEAIAAMAKSGIIAPGPALAGEFALGLLAKPGKDGAPPSIDMNASLHDGRLRLGGVELGRVPKLSWPGMP